MAFDAVGQGSQGAAGVGRKGGSRRATRVGWAAALCGSLNVRAPKVPGARSGPRRAPGPGSAQRRTAADERTADLPALKTDSGAPRTQMVMLTPRRGPADQTLAAQAGSVDLRAGTAVVCG